MSILIFNGLKELGEDSFSIEQITTELSKFNKLETISLLSNLCLIISVKDFDYSVDELQNFMISNFLDDSLIKKIEITLHNYKSEKRIFFHKQQIILAIKLLLEFGKDNGEGYSPNKSEIEKKYIGKLLIAINDHLFSEISNSEDISKEEKFKNLMTTFLPNAELNNPPSFKFSICRYQNFINLLIY